mgnify:CR=1 FL=1
MNLHEYQAKELFRRFGIEVPTGEVAATPAQAVAAERWAKKTGRLKRQG